jgi:hypothetical protein
MWFNFSFFRRMKMKRNCFFAGILTIMLVLGMTVIGCDNGTTDDGNDGGGGDLKISDFYGEYDSTGGYGQLTINAEGISCTGGNLSDKSFPKATFGTSTSSTTTNKESCTWAYILDEDGNKLGVVINYKGDRFGIFIGKQAAGQTGVTEVSAADIADDVPIRCVFRLT